TRRTRHCGRARGLARLGQSPAGAVRSAALPDPAPGRAGAALADPPAGRTGAAPVTGTIRLTGLRARGYHGVHGFERGHGQVDVALELDLAPAAGSDHVADTVDYGALADRLMAVVTGPPVRLLETLAARLAGECLADGRVVAVTVTVHKPQAPIPHDFADVAVTLRRERAA